MPMYNLTHINKIMVDSQEYSKAFLGSELIWGDYTILTPEMVFGTLGSGGQRYIGKSTHLIIDDSFPTNSLAGLFQDNQTLKSLVISTDKFTDMRSMFRGIGSQLEFLSIDTSNVSTMHYMFYESQAATLDLSSFDTSNAINMSYMFNSSQTTSLDLSSFDTSNVLYMANMFQNSQATTLDLSSFDISRATNVRDMFRDSQATTGYARTQADADKFNATSNKPEGLNFVVKGT